jgi:translocation protein SEC63
LDGAKADTGLSKVESRIWTAEEALPGGPGQLTKEKEKFEDLEDGARRKALALLWAYLRRVDLDDDALEKLKFAVAPIAYDLSRAFIQHALAYGNTTPILASFQTSQLIVQALPPKASPLLQLPYFTPNITKTVDGDSRIHTTIQGFMDQPDARRRSLVVGTGLLTEQQYETAMGVARQLPYFRVAKAFFKVAGERYIIPSSLVTLVIKGRFIPPGSEKVPDVDELDLEDVDPAEDDLDALMGRKKKQIGKDEKGKPIFETSKSEPVNPPLAHAPYFGREHAPKWHVFLTDSKQGKMAVPPFPFAQFERPMFEADGKTPTFAMQTLKAQFQAPPGPGDYTFVMQLVCDSYVGFDTKMEVTLHVEEASKAEDMAAEDEISEPEEGMPSCQPRAVPSHQTDRRLTRSTDSIAGIMNAAKGGAPPPRKKKAKAAEEDEESDEESGTEEEADDTSDTNTDTEDES